jgi:glycosyltransferase involved in cell wall biosynthesis
MVVFHVITNLTRGGAEAMLYKMLALQPPQERRPVVITLRSSNPELLQKFEALGVTVHCVSMQGLLSILGFFRLLSYFRKNLKAGDVVQTWMYHSDLIGGIAINCLNIIPFRPRIGVVWNIRRSEFPKFADKPMTALMAQLCAWGSSFLPDKIVCCAVKAQETHTQHGYIAKKIIVIPNGFNTTEFAPDCDVRKILRQEAGFDDENIVIGIVGRADPLKDHRTFLTAAKTVVTANENVRIVMMGRGLKNSETLRPLLEDEAFKNKLLILEESDRVAKALNTFDIFCLSSASEGFPNVVGEAMSCGVPCVVTDAGDVRYLLNGMGTVVPVASPVELAKALLEMAHQTDSFRKDLGSALRARIVSEFSITQVVKNYARLYEEVSSCAG